MKSWKQVREEWLSEHTPEERAEIEARIARIKVEEQAVLDRLAGADAFADET